MEQDGDGTERQKDAALEENSESMAGVSGDMLEKWFGRIASVDAKACITMCWLFCNVLSYHQGDENLLD